MKALVWTLVAVGAILWSLLAWGASLLVGWTGGIAAANAEWLTAHPETVEWLSWSASVLASLGQGTIAVAWLVGLGVLLAVPAGMALLRPSQPTSSSQGELIR